MSKELRQENNEFLLEGNMLPGEQILWQSGTGRFKLLSGANGRSILIKWAITVAVTLGIIGTYAAAATEFRSNVVVILLIIMGLIILSPGYGMQQSPGTAVHPDEPAGCADPRRS